MNAHTLKRPTSTTEPQLPQVAGMGFRCLAFLLDCLLVGVFVLFLLDKFLIPIYHPGVKEELFATYTTYEMAVRDAQEKGEPMPRTADYVTISEETLSASEFGLQITMLSFFAYFLLTERLMRGATLGKKAFRMRTVLMGIYEPPGLLQTVLRAAIKTFMLLGFIPFTWFSFILAFFTASRRTGHDRLTRTLVVREE